jgi:hypothetical protein
LACTKTNPFEKKRKEKKRKPEKFVVGWRLGTAKVSTLKPPSLAKPRIVDGPIGSTE